MDFTHSWNEIPETSGQKGEAEPRFSQESLDKFDRLWEDDSFEAADPDSKELPEHSPSDPLARYDELFEDTELSSGDYSADANLPPVLTAEPHSWNAPPESLSAGDFSPSPEPSDGSRLSAAGLSDGELPSDDSADQAQDTETKELTEEEKRQKIQDFLDGKASFDEVKEIFAEYYANAVNTNRPWSWGEDIPGGDELTGAQRKAIGDYAREKGMIPTVPTRVEGQKRYADFSQFSVFDCFLDREDWDKTDAEQFARCNEMLKKAIAEHPELADQFTDEQLAQIERGETPSGYTWHHSEVDGKMQLVPYGIHNSTYHHGGRSEGNWANAPRY